MKKIYLLILALPCFSALADNSGIYAGGGLGYGMQSITMQGASSTVGTPSVRAMAGYQFANWIDGEVGYTYITQSGDWNHLGSPSSTIYDFAFTPGFVIPSTPVALYARLGVDAVSANLDNSWYSQFFQSNVQANFEWGLGVKVDIPAARTFVRFEYVNYGTVLNNNNSNLSVNPSAIMITAAYIFK